jgi:hypothetical protein
VEGIDEIKVDGLVRDGKGRGAVVVFVHVVGVCALAVRVIFEDGMLLVVCADVVSRV